MSSKDKKKKLYSSPTLTDLTREQTIKFVANRKNCSAEQAAQFLKSLREQQRDDATDQERKRSA